MSNLPCWKPPWPDGGQLLRVDLNIAGPCDELDPRDCLLPFPNDRFTVADGSTDSGRRVQLDPRSMPPNVAGKPIDPTEWNRNDGFSPAPRSSPTSPGSTWTAPGAPRTDHITDIARYARADAPIVLLDATTGQRHPFWSELDQHAGTTDSSRLLLLRPAAQLTEGHRYVVALRQMRDRAGNVIPPTDLFRTYRDALPTPPSAPADFEARRPHLERLFASSPRPASPARPVPRVGLHGGQQPQPHRAGPRRSETTRSPPWATPTWPIARSQGRAPSFAVTKVTELTDGATLRRVEGTITVPNYLTPQVEVPPSELAPAERGGSRPGRRTPRGGARRR